MIYIYLTIVGLAFGSFVNAFVWRMHLKRVEGALPKVFKHKSTAQLSVVRGRSMCTHCGHQLESKDLVPILSWLSLGGKCRYCHKKIDDTPLPEILVPFLFVTSFYFWPYGFQGVYAAIFSLWLISSIVLTALLVYDLKWMILPDVLTKTFIYLSSVIVLLRAFDQGIGSLGLAFLGLASVGGFFYLLYAVSNGKWIGGGDVKLGYSIGLLVGTPVLGLLTIFLASVMGTLIALPQLMKKKSTLMTKIPFGPLLIVATVVVFLFGEQITVWYRALLYIP